MDRTMLLEDNSDEVTMLMEGTLDPDVVAGRVGRNVDWKGWKGR